MATPDSTSVGIPAAGLATPSAVGVASGSGLSPSRACPAITVSGLGLAYSGRAVLRAVDLAIAPGAITALIGPSGCGKTSFLSCLNRLVDLVPGARVIGTVRVGGDDVRAADSDLTALRRRVGMIFQKPNPFPLSILRNLLLPLAEHGVPRGERAGRAEEALRAVGLWAEVCDRLDAPATGLSGGQQQRLCIARALVLRPEAVLFDEPCSALDPLSSAVVEALIVSLRDRYTVVVVTHNLAQARRIADRVAVFWQVDGCGALVEEGATAAVFGAPRHVLTAAYVRGERG